MPATQSLWVWVAAPEISKREYFPSHRLVLCSLCNLYYDVRDAMGANTIKYSIGSHGAQDCRVNRRQDQLAHHF